jgi:hypothetical protein
VRVSTGFAIPLSDKLELVTEIAPTVWLTDKQTLLSLGGTLELLMRL